MHPQTVYLAIMCTICRAKKHREYGDHPPEQIIMSTHTRPQQLSVSGVSNVTSRPVPEAEFGVFVSEHHANGDMKFRESYKVFLI